MAQSVLHDPRSETAQEHSTATFMRTHVHACTLVCQYVQSLSYLLEYQHRLNPGVRKCWLCDNVTGLHGTVVVTCLHGVRLQYYLKFLITPI